MKNAFLVIFLLFFCFSAAAERSDSAAYRSQETYLSFSLDDVILDIYNAATELSEVDFEQLQSDLYALHETPIDLNNTSEEELSQIVFLSPRQIDDILMYVDKHPMVSLYELRLIPSLAEYEIRNLLPFVRVGAGASGSNKVSAADVFRFAGHELLARVDARNIENTHGTDPMYVQTRYRFDFRRRVIFGAQLRRPAGGAAEDLQYGAYLQLRDIGPLHSLVAGNFQASFGQGLVFASAFHSGKSAYVASIGQQREGLRYYSSVDGAGLHGVGATYRHVWNQATRLDATVLYSMKRANDSTWHHVLGANLTLRHQRLQVELTAAQNIWSDSIRPYRNAAYNEHYFRGEHQTVVGASARYNYGFFDAFAEVAAAENYKRFADALNGAAINSPHWGFGTLVGSRFYPASGVTLVALYRYYSPFFDNALGYAFSETSRLGDENGGYLGFDIRRWRNWRLNGYADVFYFSGAKYGIPQPGTIGFDVMAEVAWHSPQPKDHYEARLRLRARQKGDEPLYSARAIFEWRDGPWSLRTTADANLSTFNFQLSTSYGLSLAQDLSYDFTQNSAFGARVPLSLRLRLQGFDARDWKNRIYLYEHDVLYAFSIPATYGLGGRAYLCLKWQPLQILSLYLRLSETLYQRQWASAHSRAQSRTDIHLLLRLKL